MKRKLKNVVIWLLAGTKGGPTRMRILKALVEKPGNVHELSKRLGLNYRTVKYHLMLMMEHGLVERVGEGYGEIYLPSEDVEENWDEIKKLIEVIG